MVAISATTATTLPVFLTGALAVQVRHELGFSLSELGILVAVYFGSAALVSIIAGSFAERFGGEIIMRGAVLIAAATLVSIAFFAHSFLVMLGLLIVAGIANGANQPAVNIFVIGAVSPNRRGFALGVKQAAIPVSTLLSGLAVPSIALTVGWRYAYLFASIFSILIAASIPFTSSRAQRSADAKNKIRPKIALAPIITLALAIGLGVGVANALGAFLVTNAVHEHFTPGDAGLLAALGSASGLVSRLLGGYMADRRTGKHLVVIAAMLGVGALGYEGFALSNRALVIPATIICYAVGWGWNGVFNFAIVVTHPGAEGRATGTTQAGAYVGSVLGPIAFGWVVDHWSFQVAWTLSAIIVLIAAALMLLGRYLLLNRRADTDALIISNAD